MGSLITIILLLSVFLTVLSVTDDVSASSSVIYVNGSSGNDDNDGSSWLLAKKSIKNATKAITNGGTVNIANGLYTGVNNTKITIDRDITINGQSKSGTIINGTNNAWIFKIQKGKNVVIQNLTLANGYRFVTEHDENSDEIYDSDGGAIINKGILTVKDSNFIGNTASNGGAIFNWGSLTVTGSTFTGNTACVSGGAIYVLGTSAIIDSTFTKNSATYGGAIDKEADLTLKNCIFINNRGYAGGVILNDEDYGALDMAGNIFNDNTARYGNNIWTITEFDDENDTSDPADTNQNLEPAVKAVIKTTGMKPTGIPLAGFLVAVLMVLSGLTIPRRK
ncbi:MAG: hypothetical protein ABFD07_14925 [Methanobacterium sp.]